MTNESLTISKLRAGYGGVTVLHDIDIEVKPGEVVALVGPNGGGKSTTLLACSGLVKVESGEIKLGDRNIQNLAPNQIVKAGVVQVPEDRSLFYSLTVEENLRVASGSPSFDAFELFPELKPLRRRRSALLSGGEQQMLCLARALYCEPRVLLVDEMSLGLAPLIVERLFEALRDFATRLNIGVLVVEQHVHLALKHVERGYVLSAGRITAEGSAAELEARWPEIEASYLGVAA
ncbi:ABC transporter ATP-binding protein [Planosporangium sp. 12N6]|uniref:ABC transporter ATP-binding protein n=1 Tax=Planosporangium spinosum TaxID=3402278 RepID=UPI003CEE69B3